MSEKRENKSYSKEFEEKSVALISEQGYSVAQAASTVGIRTNQLYRWKQKQEELKSGSLLSSKAELIRLRKEKSNYG